MVKIHIKYAMKIVKFCMPFGMSLRSQIKGDKIKNSVSRKCFLHQVVTENAIHIIYLHKSSAIAMLKSEKEELDYHEKKKSKVIL